MPVDKKKINETKVEEENTKIANSEESVLVTPIFFGFWMIGGTNFTNCGKFWEISQKQIEEIKGKAGERLPL